MNGTFYNIIGLKIQQILSRNMKKLYLCAKNLILNRAINLLYCCCCCCCCFCSEIRSAKLTQGPLTISLFNKKNQKSLRCVRTRPDLRPNDLVPVFAADAKAESPNFPLYTDEQRLTQTVRVAAFFNQFSIFFFG